MCSCQISYDLQKNVINNEFFIKSHKEDGVSHLTEYQLHIVYYQHFLD